MSEQKMREALIAMMKHNVSLDRDGDKARVKAYEAIAQPACVGLTNSEANELGSYLRCSILIVDTKE